MNNETILEDGLVFIEKTTAKLYVSEGGFLMQYGKGEKTEVKSVKYSSAFGLFDDYELIDKL